MEQDSNKELKLYEIGYYKTKSSGHFGGIYLFWAFAARIRAYTRVYRVYMDSRAILLHSEQKFIEIRCLSSENGPLEVEKLGFPVSAGWDSKLD